MFIMQGDEVSHSQDIGPNILDLVNLENVVDGIPLIDWQETVQVTDEVGGSISLHYTYIR